MDEPAESIASGDLDVGVDGSGNGLSGLACFKARWGRWALKWSSYAVRSLRRCAALTISVRSRSSRRTLPTQRSVIAFMRGA
jgi:hypothetical protein